MRLPSFTQLFALLFMLFASLLAGSTLYAWTGPTQAAPGGNVSAPINVGTTDQVKNAGLSVNALTVFGSGYVQNNLGVGRTSPVVALDVNGTLRIANGGEVCQSVTAGALRYSGGAMQFCNGSAWTSIAAGSGAQWTTSGSNIYYSAGTVAIGTTPSSSWALYAQNAANGVYGYTTGNGYGVYGYAPAAGGVGVRGDGNAYGGYFSSTASGAGAYLGYGSWGLYTGNQVGASIYYDTSNTGYYADPSASSNFNSVNAAAYSAGGVAGVSGALDHCWDYEYTYTTGLITRFQQRSYLCGADVAEPYPTDGAIPVERGYIVAPSSTTASYDLTVTNPAKGESTTTPYLMTVAKMHVALPGEREAIYGAVPTRAFDLARGDRRDASEQLVSLAGHVPVHVTLENGPIAIGDPITLSSTKAGYGTKATTPGKILGYALAPYTGGDAMIEVSMQVGEWQPAGEICASDASGSTCVTKTQLDALLQK